MDQWSPMSRVSIDEYSANANETPNFTIDQYAVASTKAPPNLTRSRRYIPVSETLDVPNNNEPTTQSELYRALFADDDI